MPLEDLAQSRNWAVPTLVPSTPIYAWLAVLDSAIAEGPAPWPAVVIDLSVAPLHAPGLRALVGELGGRGIRVIGLANTTEDALGPEAARLPPILVGAEAGEAAAANAAPLPRPTPPVPLLTIERSLRSGQVIRHDGDVAIIGNVASGAEVIAGGSVYVYGTLHGRAFAGRPDSRIFCRKLEAELLSIAGAFLTADDIIGGLRGQAAVAWMEADAIRVAPLEN